MGHQEVWLAESQWAIASRKKDLAHVTNLVVGPSKPPAVVFSWPSGVSTIIHNQGEYARDDDGDGVREVHCNTMEGIWTGLRNFLRPFRGVNKEYLEQYIIIFQWSYNLKAVTDVFLRCLLGCSVATEFVT